MSGNSKRTRIIGTESNPADVEASSIDDNADSTPATSTSEISELTISEDGVTPIDVFTSDILPGIFDNLEILSPKDLLNFRLVNRLWRDAATSVILKRNLCEIGLNFGAVLLGKDEEPVGVTGYWGTRSSRPSLDYFNEYEPKRFISDLSQLISTSPQFPSSSIHFHSGCAWGFGLGSHCPIADDDEDRADLLAFFSLYGKKIRKLSLSSGISKIAVQNLLYVHMPNLICLDVQHFERFSFQEREEEKDREVKVCLPPPASTLQIQEIFLGHILSSETPDSKLSFLKELLSVCPNLSAIQHVDTSLLEFEVLLEAEKSHLIQSLLFSPSLVSDDISSIAQFATLLTDSILENNNLLKLSRLTVRIYPSYGHGTKENRDGILRALNIILSASKDSLKYLVLEYTNDSVDPVNLFIPPLSHLKNLELVDSMSGGLATRFHFLGDVMGRAVRAGEGTADQSAFASHAISTLQNKQGSANIPANYFPRLRQVNLHMSKNEESAPDKLLMQEFFSLEHLGPDGMTTIPGDSLSSVVSLELNPFSDFDRTLAQLFPNVCHLKITCESSRSLRNWIWTAFQKLERFEISALIYGPNSDWNSNDVDSFFTGISPEASEPERTQPYIGDCENLKEFKINFGGKLNSKFASNVTAARGFQEVIHRTKIIFSFRAAYLSEAEIQETYHNLDPVAAYVEIQMLKSK